MNKFNLGDIVRVADPLPKYMRHFMGEGKCAVVVGVSRERDAYALMFKEHDDLTGFRSHYPEGFTSSWYPDDVLYLISKNDRELDRDYWLKRLKSL